MSENGTGDLQPKKVSDSITKQFHVVMHEHINGINRLFGGQLLSWIDEIAAITAKRHCGRDATTVAVDNLQFKSGAYLNDLVVLVGKVTYVGNTSLEVRVDSYVETNDGTRHPINRAYFVMVCMGDNDRPAKVPPLLIENDAEQYEWENGQKRKELREQRKREGY
ncbi:MAG: acyl-CoA thioesterase [Lachnospiraceae bacterium]|nr:acyl-CoA thioesterase [Lachnospiraceae bacterium]MBO6209027.1 acyl-CoA thioesterase [Lachnospiraceae bacterium]